MPSPQRLEYANRMAFEKLQTAASAPIFTGTPCEIRSHTVFRYPSFCKLQSRLMLIIKYDCYRLRSHIIACQTPISNKKLRLLPADISIVHRARHVPRRRVCPMYLFLNSAYPKPSMPHHCPSSVFLHCSAPQRQITDITINIMPSATEPELPKSIVPCTACLDAA